MEGAFVGLLVTRRLIWATYKGGGLECSVSGHRLTAEAACYRPKEETQGRRLSRRHDPSKITVFRTVLSKSFRSITRQRQMLGEDGDNQFVVALRYGLMDMNTVLMAL